MKLKKPIMLILAILGGLLLLLGVYKSIAFYGQLKIESRIATENKVREDFADPTAQTVILHLYKEEYAAAAAAIEAHPEVLSEKDKGGGSILSYIIWKKTDPKDVRFLLDAGADPSFPEGHAPISSATENAGVEIVKILLEAGADPNGKSGSESALWRAALRGNIEMMELLISHGANMNEPDDAGDSPMMAAAQSTQYESVLFLLERGATPFFTNERGETIGTWILEGKVHPDTPREKARAQALELLKEKGFPWPFPTEKEVLEMQKNGEWPPKSVQ